MRRFIPWCFLLALVISAPAHAATSVAVGIALGKAPPPPVIVFRGEPQLIVIPTNGVSYYNGPSSYDYFRYGPYYYIYNDGYWYRARHARGPFFAIREAHVPLVFYGLHDRGYRWKHAWKRVSPGQVRKMERKEYSREYRHKDDQKYKYKVKYKDKKKVERKHDKD